MAVYFAFFIKLTGNETVSLHSAKCKLAVSLSCLKAARYADNYAYLHKTAFNFIATSLATTRPRDDKPSFWSRRDQLHVVGMLRFMSKT